MNQPKLNVSLSDTTAIKCECGNGTFVEGAILRKISRLLAGTAEDAIMPINAFICVACNAPLQQTLPTNLPND